MTEIVDIVLPEGQQEGTTSVISSWLKQPGDSVSEHEPIAEMETDKVVVEIAAPASGTVTEILKNAGDPVAPGDVLGRIDAGAATEESIGSDSTTVPSEAVAAATRGRAVNGDRQKLSPMVRRLVKQYDLDPEAIGGTGRSGRITAGDIHKHLESLGKSGPDVEPLPPLPENRPEPRPEAPTPQAKAPQAKAAPAPTPAAPKPLVQVNADASAASRLVPHDTMRRRIAEHMVQSLMTTAPHVTSVFEADMSRVAAHRRISKPEFAGRGVNLTYTAYFVSACARALEHVPEVNSRWHDDALEIFGDANIGVGTALGDDGLVVPVLHGAQKLDLFEIAEGLQLLTAKARGGGLVPADVQNGTFTISNHGVSGSLLAAPIVINQPQSAILGVGKMEKRVIVREVDGQDTLQVRPMCYVTLTIDHRALDAHQTNRFLSKVVEVLEHWSDAG